MEKRRDFTNEELMQMFYAMINSAGNLPIDCAICPFRKFCEKCSSELSTCKAVMEEYFKRGAVEPDLDVCLMCGSENVILEESCDGYYILCNDCGLRTSTRIKSEKDDLIREWNYPRQY